LDGGAAEFIKELDGFEVEEGGERVGVGFVVCCSCCCGVCFNFCSCSYCC
jgi:hypothetical protein